MGSPSSQPVLVFSADRAVLWHERRLALPRHEAPLKVTSRPLSEEERNSCKSPYWDRPRRKTWRGARKPAQAASA